MKDRMLKDLSTNLEVFVAEIKMLDISTYNRGITKSFEEIQRLKDMFKSIWTKTEHTYDLPALKKIKGEFSILLDINRLREYTIRH